jgi:ElaB/YqjD/DUF883 family membrane-anchored ribosome-binding protein
VETAEQIRQKIQEKREELGANLGKLEQKVKDVTDWRKQFRDRPFSALGVAFGAGVLLAGIFSGRRGGWDTRDH